MFYLFVRVLLAVLVLASGEPLLAAGTEPDAGDVHVADRAAVPTPSVTDTGAAGLDGPMPQGFAAGGPVELYDLLDAAARGQEEGPIADLYAANLADYRHGRSKLSGRSGATRRQLAGETFSSPMGLTAWTAASCRRTVMATLDWLARKRKSAGQSLAARLYARMEHELLLDLASQARARNGDDRLAKALQAGTGPSGGWTVASLTNHGVDYFDYSLAAMRVMEWVDRRDELLGTEALAGLMATVPDPAAPAPPLAELAREVERLTTAAWGTGPGAEDSARASAELAPKLATVRRAAEERRAALAALAAVLGVRAVNTAADLERLLRRHLRADRQKAAALAKLEEALRRYTEAARAQDAALVAYRDARDRCLAAGSQPPAGPVTAVAGTPQSSEEAGALFESIDPGSVPSRLRNELYRQDLTAKVDFVDLEVAEGIGISARYKWEVDGNVQDRYFTRVDTWELTGNIRVGDLLSDLVTLPFGVNASGGEKIVMARQFKSMLDAAKALPKTPLALPFTAENARKMQLGDFYSIPADVAFATSIGAGYAAGLLSGNVGMSYVVSGRFRIQVFRTGADHVRVRLVAARGQGPAASAGASGSIELFGIRILDRAVERLIGSRFAEFGWSNTTGVNFVADYVFDLRNAAACAAYDQVMRACLKAGPRLAANALLRANRLDTAMLNDLRPAEEMTRQDAGLEPSLRRVNRLFKGLNTYHSKSRSFGIGVRLLRFDRSSSWVENRLRVYDSAEASRDIEFPVHSFRSRFGLLFGLFKEETEESLYALMPIEPGAARPRVAALVLSHLSSDRSASVSEIRNFQQAVANALGEYLAQQLDLDQFLVGAVRNFSGQVTFAVYEQLLDELLDAARTPEEKVWDGVARVIHGVPNYVRPAVQESPSSLPWDFRRWSEPKRKAYQACEDEWGDAWPELERTVEGLLAIQKKGQGTPLADRVVELLQLGDEPLLRKILVRLLVELTGRERLEENCFITVGANARDTRPFQATFGEDRFKELLAAVNEMLYNSADREMAR